MRYCFTREKGHSSSLDRCQSRLQKIEIELEGLHACLGTAVP